VTEGKETGDTPSIKLTEVCSGWFGLLMPNEQCQVRVDSEGEGEDLLGVLEMTKDKSYVYLTAPTEIA
jgi:hypothetical protein